MATLTDINGIGPALAERLGASGIETVEAVASSKPVMLATVKGLSEATAAKVIAEAETLRVDLTGHEMLERVATLEDEVRRLTVELEALETGLKGARKPKAVGKARTPKSKDKAKKSKKKSKAKNSKKRPNV